MSLSSKRESLARIHVRYQRAGRLHKSRTMDTILVHPREGFRLAIITMASAAIVLHNRPSGESSLSDTDIMMTRDFIRAGQLLKIEVRDHVIVGTGSFSSLRALGNFWQ
jgi:DNA repair protein RadC